MIFSNDRTTKDALLNTLSEEQTAAWVREEQAAAWARFYAIEVDSRPGELEYDRALAAAKRLDTGAVANIVAAGGGTARGDWPLNLQTCRRPHFLDDRRPRPVALARSGSAHWHLAGINWPKCPRAAGRRASHASLKALHHNTMVIGQCGDCIPMI